MRARRVDRVGRLKIVAVIPGSKGILRQYICRCDCGKSIARPTDRVHCGDVRSCGCLRSDRMVAMNKSTEARARSRTNNRTNGERIKSCSSPGLCLVVGSQAFSYTERIMTLGTAHLTVSFSRLENI